MCGFGTVGISVQGRSLLQQLALGNGVATLVVVVASAAKCRSGDVYASRYVKVGGLDVP